MHTTHFAPNAPQRINSALALSCSPRKGNSDTAVQAFSRGFSSAGGRLDLLHLREHRILACTSCGACERFAPAHALRPDSAHPDTAENTLSVLAGRSGRICPLATQDDSAELFARLYTAPALFIAAPIYFYHLPALFKGFIDRAQAFWMLGSNNDVTINALPRRPAWLALTAGRAVGERLFEGSLLTLRYFCDIFNFELRDPLLLPGFDAPDAISRVPAVVEKLHQYGEQAARYLQEQ